MSPLKIAQFWSKVDVRDDPADCWPWQRGLDRGGYGAFKLDGRSQGAHRIAVQLFFGKPIDGVIVRHRCDNRICCNPFHLDIGSHNDNVQDRVERGRSAAGTSNGRAKLTEQQVLAIRADERTHAAIAASFNVDRSTVSHIKQRIIWKHLL